jgi:hypothetical protein
MIEAVLNRMLPQRLSGIPMLNVAYGTKDDGSKRCRVYPPGKTYDPALRFCAIGHVRSDVGQLDALADHNPTDQRSQSNQMPGC